MPNYTVRINRGGGRIIERHVKAKNKTEARAVMPFKNQIASIRLTMQKPGQARRPW